MSSARIPGSLSGMSSVRFISSIFRMKISAARLSGMVSSARPTATAIIVSGWNTLEP